jgi:thiosulfate dehydrogenase
MRWLSFGIPSGAKLIGTGTLAIVEPARAADPSRGAQVFAQVCAACHHGDGLGQRAEVGLGYQFPPLWGPDSFNNGAGMSRLLTLAAFAKHNMPVGTTFSSPVLDDEDAYDVAGYILAQARPVKANLDRDYPVRLEKPIDSPYGPYADNFSQRQHRFGPFGPIRARVREMEAAPPGAPSEAPTPCRVARRPRHGDRRTSRRVSRRRDLVCYKPFPQGCRETAACRIDN